MKQVWLITGAGSGLGKSIATAVLKNGDQVIATARRSDDLQSLFKQFGDSVYFSDLDVRDESAAKRAVKLATDKFGRLDIVVNNAGYGQFEPFEQMKSEDFKAVMDVNFFGLIYTTRAALPVMRHQGSGKFLQISSIAGRLGMPGNSPYVAAKSAVGGFCDALRLEVEPLGVQVCVLEPGGIRTDWSRRANSASATAVMPAYEATVGAMLKRLRESDGKQENDPERIATLLLKLANMTTLPHRLVLGVDALKAVMVAEDARQEELKTNQELSRSTIFPS